jgi:hypothetical protein
VLIAVCIIFGLKLTDQGNRLISFINEYEYVEIEEEAPDYTPQTFGKEV